MERNGWRQEAFAVDPQACAWPGRFDCRSGGSAVASRTLQWACSK